MKDFKEYTEPRMERKSDEIVIEFFKASTTVLKNGSSINITPAPYIHEGKMMINIDDFAELMGWTLEKEEGKRIITLKGGK